MKGTKKLIISVMALVITLAMAVTSTYAWFTTNTYATVSGFDVTVKSEDDEGLFVRLKDTATYTSGYTNSFVASLATADILDAIKYNVNTSTPTAPSLVPVTSADGKVFKRLSGSGVITGDATLAASSTAEVTGNGTYAWFTLEFQSTKAGIITLVGDKDGSLQSKITAGTGSSATGRSMTAWDLVTDTLGASNGNFDGLHKSQLYEDVTGKTDYATGASVALRAFNAARVTFDSQTTGDTDYVWAPNAMKDAVQVGYYKNAYNWTVTLPSDYKNTKANQITMLNVTSGSGGSADTLSDDATTICTLEQAEGASTYTATVVVYIWLDGNDGSCINNISGDSFKVDMSFRRIDAPSD